MIYLKGTIKRLFNKQMYECHSRVKLKKSKKFLKLTII